MDVLLSPFQPGWSRGFERPTYLLSCQVEGREKSSDVPDVHFEQGCFSTLRGRKTGRAVGTFVRCPQGFLRQAGP